LYHEFPSPFLVPNGQVDVFIMVADPLGFLLESKEYLAPILSPHEAMLAFSDRSLDLTARYPLDFLEVIQVTSSPQLCERTSIKRFKDIYLLMNVSVMYC
jgi:hypothetical protein